MAPQLHLPSIFVEMSSKDSEISESKSRSSGVQNQDDIVATPHAETERFSSSDGLFL